MYFSTSLLSQGQIFNSTTKNLKAKEYPLKFEQDDKVIQNLYGSLGPYSKFDPTKEIFNKRTEDSKTFLNEDGTFTSLIAAGPMHYYEDGLWKTSSNQIINNVSKPGYLFANVNNKIKTYFGDASTGIKSVKINNEILFSTYRAQSISLFDADKNEKQIIKEYDNSDPVQIDYNKLGYELNSNIKYEVEQYSDKIKTQYIIDSNTFSNFNTNDYIGFSEIFEFEDEVYTVRIDTANYEGLYFINSKGEKIIAYKDILYFSKGFDLLIHNKRADYVLKKINNKSYKITILIPVSWLNDDDTHYPIIIDPSVICNPTNANFWTGVNFSATTGNNNNMATGFYDCPGCTNERWRAFSKFNLSSIPDNACLINNVTWEYYQYNWINGNGSDGLRFDAGWANTDPIPDPWNTINNALDNLTERYSSWNVWGTQIACTGCNFGGDYDENTNNAWKNFNIDYALARSRIQNRLTSDYITLGHDVTANANDCFFCPNDESNIIYFRGYSSNERPKLTITYVDPITISTQPSNATICTDGTYLPSISASGGGTLSYQWQYNNGGTWVNVSNGTPANSTYSNPTSANTFSVSGFIAAGTYEYQCVVSSTGSGCSSVTSNTATLTIIADPSLPTINSISPNESTVCEGTPLMATFNPGTGGTGCTDAFQYSINGGASWSAYIPGDNIISGSGGTTILIQGKRDCSGNGCDGSAETFTTLASWTVIYLPSIIFLSPP